MPCNVLWIAKYIQDWTNDVHQHGYFQIMCILNGQGYMVVDDREYNIEKEQIYIIPPDKWHGLFDISNHQVPLQVIDVKFLVKNSLLYNDLTKLCGLIHAADFLFFYNQISKLLSESSERKMYYSEMINLKFSTIIIDLVRSKLECSEPDKDCIQVVENKNSIEGSVNITEILKYINVNYSNTITLDILSKFAGINKTTLIHIFKEYYGTTPIKYLNIVRIEKAKELLLNSNLTVSEISEIVGFQSIHYFSRYFKSKESCSPMEYRLKNKNSKFYFLKSDVSIKSYANSYANNE